jgi:hypothetical protein
MPARAAAGVVKSVTGFTNAGNCHDSNVATRLNANS